MNNRYFKELEEIENELKELVNKMKKGNSFDMNMLMYTKCNLLYGKFLKIQNIFLNEYKSFRKEKIKWIIRTYILLIISIIYNVLNPTMFASFLSMFVGLFNVWVLTDDVLTEREYSKTLKWCKENSISDNIFNECKSLIKENQIKNSIKKEDMVLYDKALNRIMFFLYDSRYNLDLVSKEELDMMVKILQNELKSDEEDCKVLLDMAKKDFNSNSKVLSLKK